MFIIYHRIFFLYRLTYDGLNLLNIYKTLFKVKQTYQSFIFL